MGFSVYFMIILKILHFITGQDLWLVLNLINQSSWHASLSIIFYRKSSSATYGYVLAVLFAQRLIIQIICYVLLYKCTKIEAWLKPNEKKKKRGKHIHSEHIQIVIHIPIHILLRVPERAKAKDIWKDLGVLSSTYQHSLRHTEGSLEQRHKVLFFF